MRSVPVGLIDECPTNPREFFEGIEELAADIKARGLLTSLILREKKGGRFEVVSGARRLRALRLNGAGFVVCTIRNLDDRDTAVTQLAEESHRSSLQPMERAKAIGRLQKEFGFTRERIAASLNKSLSWVQDQIRLLHLPPEACREIDRAGLSTTHAQYIARQETPEKRVAMAKSLARKPMSVTAARVAFGQLKGLTPYERGQLSMRDRIARLLKAAAMDAAEEGNSSGSAALYAQAQAVSKLEAKSRAAHPEAA